MCYCTCAGVETATEKWGGGGGRDFLYHIACEVRHLGGFGGMPPPTGFWGPLEAVWCNLRLTRNFKC